MVAPRATNGPRQKWSRILRLENSSVFAYDDRSQYIAKTLHLRKALYL